MSTRNRFDKFTERARKVLSLAQEEAQRFQHNYIGTEHLLLGLVREGEGVAAKVLQSMGVSLARVRSSVEYIIGRGDHGVLSEIGLTPRAKKVIELAVDEARRLNHHYIGTEHLLLGLIREGEGIAAGVLESLGVKLEQVRQQTLAVLSGSAAQFTAPTTADAPVEEAGRPPVGEAGRPQGIAPTMDEELPEFVPDVEDTIPATTTSGLLPQDRLDKFTERTMKVFGYAQEEARNFQHNYIGTEHLLLGLVHDDKGIAAQVLRNMGVELEKVRSAVEFILGHGDRIIPGEVGLTPRSRKVIELAIDEAKRMNSPYVGTGHLLLGLIREGEGVAAGVLESLGVNFPRARQQTIRGLEKQ